MGLIGCFSIDFTGAFGIGVVFKGLALAGRGGSSDYDFGAISCSGISKTNFIGFSGIVIEIV
jgi:hypothetical protein